MVDVIVDSTTVVNEFAVVSADVEAVTMIVVRVPVEGGAIVAGAMKIGEEVIVSLLGVWPVIIPELLLCSGLGLINIVLDDAS